MDARISDAWENPFSGGALGEALEVPAGGGEPEPEEKVFVAVPVPYKNGKSVLTWALRHAAAVALAGASTVVVVVVAHVHAPAQMIPMMGSKFHVSKLRPEHVSAYRQYEKDKVQKYLDEYIQQCSKLKVKCEKLVIENADVAGGIVELVSKHSITKLVMGAAADKHYSRKMKMPKSKTALTVLQRADTSCKIWFACKEHLICTREAASREVGDLISLDIPTPPASRSSVSPLPSNQCASNAIERPIQSSMSVSGKVVPKSVITSFRLPSLSATRTTLSSRLSLEDNSAHSWDSIPRGTFPGSHQTSSTVTDDGFSDSSSFSIPRDDASEILHSAGAGCQLLNPASYHEQGATDPNTGLFDKLEEASTEVEKYQKDESLRPEGGEELILFQKANQRKELDTALAKSNDDIEVMKQEMDALKQDRDDIIAKLIKMSEQKATLEKRVNEYFGIVKDLEDVLAANKSVIDSQQLEYEKVKHERDSALKDADELRREKEKTVSCSSLACNTEFSLSELRQATEDFSDTMKVGEGGFGSVFKGVLRNTTVAIKMLRCHNIQGQSQFQQEVDVLSRVRHPNLVTLIGTCSEASGLVYEFLPNGSLEDRLACENGTPPLTWQVRTRIIGEICAALIFLHSNKPHPIIHGDLKPANILLDANLVSKLCDFGISCLLNKSSASTSLYQTTNPRGTFAYMDPEFLTTGELTSRSDIYSFGIVILQLVTGKQALGIGRAVEDALDKDELQLLVDPSAGEWPFDQAKRLMLLGLHCVELSRRRRPDRMSDVWCVVEPLMESAAWQSSGHRFVEGHAPSYFLCPISQEVMRNPLIAADGFTYEAEFIKGWLDCGRHTSPMTKSRLAHCHLTPNHALRSAIQEYFQQQQEQ